MRLRLRQLVSIFCLVSLSGLVLLLISISGAVQAAVPVASHRLNCSGAFPCPKELHRRTDFWIQVYSKWTTKQGVFHDSQNPERVYSVKKLTNGCNGKSNTVTNERNRIKKQLLRIAKQLEAGKRPGNGSDKAMLALFPDKKGKSLRDASRHIRCQQGNRDRFESALKRYGAYGGLVKKLIVDAGLPSDTHYLPFVESLYNPGAYSRVGAAGLWQIMPRTARVLGLELNATVDERLDLEAATIAAARYLKDSRNRLTAVARKKKPSVSAQELTPFVMTSYNYGVNGMRRALNQFGPDFIKILNRYKSPSFQVAVKNFYTSFLAARHVAKNSSKYFGEIKPEPRLRYHTVVLKNETSMERILKVFGLQEDELKPYNRALTRFVWHGWRLAPQGYRLRLPHSGSGWNAHIARLHSLPPEDDSRRPVKYTVRKGDTACGIARAFRVKCTDLVDMNRLGRRAFIRIGQVLVIPGRRGESKSVARRTVVSSDGSYKVRKGDSPCGIAIRLGVQCHELLSLNGLGKRAVIYPGQRLKIPGKSFSRKQAESTRQGSLKVQAGSTAVTSYTVKPHDTPCEIAEYLSLKCEYFMRFNKLTSRSVLSIGQVLKVPGDAKAHQALSSGTPDFELVVYTVKPGDTPCQIARNNGMDCADFQNINNLKRHSVIYVGQKLKIKTPRRGQAASQLAATKTPKTNGIVDADIAGDASTTPLDTRLDLKIRTRNSNGALRHYIDVEDEETLGHYADWLGIGSISPIRTLNSLKLNQLLITGQRLNLPVKTDAQKNRFARQRDEYHRVLVEEFKENYRVTGIDSYKVRLGDSPWRIADRFQLPLWVITRYNPVLRKRDPVSGEILKIPQIKARG